MPFSPDDFLTVARELSGGDTEAHYRSAVSRAYYAVFWQARLVLEQSGDSVSAFGESSHNRVWDYLVADHTRDGVSIGERARVLKDRRIHADYRQRVMTAREAELVVEWAEALIAELKRLMGNG